MENKNVLLADFNKRLQAIREEKLKIEHGFSDLRKEMAKRVANEKDVLKKLELHDKRKKKLEQHISSTKKQLAKDKEWVSGPPYLLISSRSDQEKRLSAIKRKRSERDEKSLELESVRLLCTLLTQQSKKIRTEQETILAEVLEKCEKFKASENDKKNKKLSLEVTRWSCN